MAKSKYNNDYIDDTSKDPELMCNICCEYFKDPYSTQCDHTFCYQCIMERIRIGNSICPRCAKPISIYDIKPASRIIRDMLNRTRVICKYCEQTGIQRENFDDHLKKSCLKIEVICSASDVYCPWKGPRGELDSHLKTCAYNSLHSILNKLIIENRQLKEQIKQLQEHCDEKHLNETKDIDDTKNFVQTSFKQLYDQLDIDENRIEKHDIEIEHLKNQIIEMDIQIKKLQEENDYKKYDTSHLNQQCYQHNIQIKQLINKMNLILNMINYQNFSLNDYIEKCEENLLNLNEKKINDQDIFIIIQQGIIKKNYQELNLQSNNITCQGALILSDSLINNEYLENLNLNENNLSDLGVLYLSQILSIKNHILKKLYLASNNITDEGAEQLAEMLKTNQTLTYLNLQNNKISNRGIQSLANTLAYPNKTLEELIVDENKMINDLCIEILVNMLIQNRSLKTLRICQCNLSEIGLIRLKDIVKLKNNFTLYE